MIGRGWFSNFYFLVAFVLATELSYGWWQEILYGVYKFKYVWFATLIQCMSYAVFSALQCKIQTGHFPTYHKESFPLYGYLAIGSASLIGRVSGNMAFIYMDYGLKVLFTSTNPILVMATGIFYRQTYTLREYIATSMLVVGLILFSYADSQMIDRNFSLIGVGLMLFAVTMEAIKMRENERIMKQYKCPEVDVTFWGSIFGIICSLIAVLFSGQLTPSLTFFYENPHAFISMMLIFVFGYTSLIASLSLILVSDSFVSSVVSTARKALSVFISLIAFGKQVTFQHALALVLFFGGILWQTSFKRKKTKKV